MEHISHKHTYRCDGESGKSATESTVRLLTQVEVIQQKLEVMSLDLPQIVNPISTLGENIKDYMI